MAVVSTHLEIHPVCTLIQYHSAITISTALFLVIESPSLWSQLILILVSVGSKQSELYEYGGSGGIMKD